MLQFRVGHRSIRLAAQLGQNPHGGQRLFMQTTATTSANAEVASKPTSILSRLSDRTRSRVRRNSEDSDAPIKVAADAQEKPRHRATSFISARSAQQRDNAAEKWFTDVRQLDIDPVNRPDRLESLPRKKGIASGSPEQHEMRPRIDLNALFTQPTYSAVSLRVQTKKELGGDYARYLPDGFVDPHRLPVDYARLVIGRNKHISLNAQTGALNVIEEAIRGRTARQGI